MTANRPTPLRDPTEKIAREICWDEFAVKPRDTTKARYWNNIAPASRLEYLREARLFVRLYHTIPADLLNATETPAK